MKFKGHTTIELKNVETGEVKIYEDDNMLTNYINKVVDFIAKHSLGTCSWNPYSSGFWNNLLGGLVLFDTALTEDADAFWLPAGVKPVGYGMVGDTNSYVSIPNWGFYNTEESDTSQTDTKIMVWSFDTNKANGTIASVALTHKNNALFGFGSEGVFSNTQRGDSIARIALASIVSQSSKGKQAAVTGNYGVVGSNLSLNDGSYVNFCIDSDNDVKYMFKVCQNGLSIIKHNMYPEKFDFFRTSIDFQSYVEETYSETFDGSYFYHFYNTDEKVLYFWTLSSASYYTKTSLTLTIHKFDMTSKVLTKAWKTATLTTTNNSNIYHGIAVTSSALYYYVDKSGGNELRKYDFSGGASSVIRDGSMSQFAFYGGHLYILNSLIYIEAVINSGGSANYWYDAIIDTSDDTLRITNARGNYDGNNYYRNQFVPPIDNTQVVFGSNIDGDAVNNGLFMNLQQSGNNMSAIGNTSATIHYLGTINNLSEPVVKTAQQTMKVTYTITKEEEE